MAQILLVDDDIASLKGLKMCFDLKNFPTISATTVSTALQLLDTEKISLVCTEWDLPGGRTGLDMLAYARERNIPIVFLTGHDEDSYEKSALEQGTVRYYTKGQLSYLKFRDDLIEIAEKEQLKDVWQEVSKEGDNATTNEYRTPACHPTGQPYH